jgi:hypothetical protein
VEFLLPLVLIFTGDVPLQLCVLVSCLLGGVGRTQIVPSEDKDHDCL